MQAPLGYGFWPNDTGNPTGVNTQTQIVNALTADVTRINDAALTSYKGKCGQWLQDQAAGRSSGPKPSQPVETVLDIIPGVNDAGGPVPGIFLGYASSGKLLGSPCPDPPPSQPMPKTNPIGPQMSDGTYQNESVWNGAPFYPLGFVWTAADGATYKQMGIPGPFGIWAWWVKQ